VSMRRESLQAVNPWRLRWRERTCGSARQPVITLARSAWMVSSLSIRPRLVEADRALSLSFPTDGSFFPSMTRARSVKLFRRNDSPIKGSPTGRESWSKSLFRHFADSSLDGCPPVSCLVIEFHKLLSGGRARVSPLFYNAVVLER
jgi:hypothetical protein